MSKVDQHGGPYSSVPIEIYSVYGRYTNSTTRLIEQETTPTVIPAARPSPSPLISLSVSDHSALQQAWAKIKSTTPTVVCTTRLPKTREARQVAYIVVLPLPSPIFSL